MEVRALTAADVADVGRLHRFSSTAGGSVFGTRDLTEVLSAAAEQSEGVFGFVALLTDPEEPEEPEVVGALTAQWDNGTGGNSSSSTCSSDASSSGSSGARQLEQLTPATGSTDVLESGQEVSVAGDRQVVLLTLVVRADVRRQGVGTALLAALMQHTLQRLQHQQQTAVRPTGGHIVADVALANAQAWSFFKRAGFRQGSSSGPTAEAVLDLDVPQLESASIYTTAGDDGSDAAPRTAAAAVQPANKQGCCWLAAPAQCCLQPQVPSAMGTFRMMQRPKQCVRPLQPLRAQHRNRPTCSAHNLRMAVCI